MPEWEVDLFVYGPITVKGSVELYEEKASSAEPAFYSNIQVRPIQSGSGVRINMVARADEGRLARRAALHFIGQTLDVLTLTTKAEMYLSLLNRPTVQLDTPQERRIITRTEWHHAFQTAQALKRIHPDFLRALSWYRKGLCTEDPFDKFLAFWNSIEVVASKNFPSGTCKGKGSKCHIWECFKLIWGECRNWPEIAGKTQWIDENYDTRKDIAHGTVSVNIRSVENVFSMLENLKRVAYTFLKDWENKQIHLVNYENS